MTPTSTPTHATATATATATDQPPGLPRVRSRRNPVLLAAGAALVVTGAAGVAWLITSVADATPVLVTTQSVAAGEAIGSDDLAIAQVSLDPAVAAIPADQRANIVGQRASSALPAGLLLTPSSVTNELVPPPGMSLVGVAVTPAQQPATELHAGDRVTLVAGARDGDDLPTTPGPSLAATVAGSRLLDDGSTVVDVSVPTSQAPRLAGWASTGRVVIVLQTAAR